MKGKFITIYGINNIGKSYHAKLLVERLNAEGKKAMYLKYPIYDMGPSGPFLNMMLRNPEGQQISEEALQLWFVMNRYQYQAQLQNFLEQGYIVVAEDYTGTGLAWGMAKGLEEEWLVEINKYLLKEDFSILFEGERKMKSVEENHVHEQNEDLIKKCIQTHSHLANKYGWKRLEVHEDKEETANRLWEMVQGFLDRV